MAPLSRADRARFDATFDAYVADDETSLGSSGLSGAQLVHICTVVHHTLGSKHVVSHTRLLVVTAEALWILELDRKGAASVRRQIELGALTQLTTFDATTQLNLRVGGGGHHAAEVDELMTVREMGTDLDRRPEECRPARGLLHGLPSGLRGLAGSGW